MGDGGGDLWQGARGRWKRVRRGWRARAACVCLLFGLLGRGGVGVHEPCACGLACGLASARRHSPAGQGGGGRRGGKLSRGGNSTHVLAGEHLPELSIFQYLLRCTRTARQGVSPLVLVHDWCVFLPMHGAAHVAHGWVSGHMSSSPLAPFPRHAAHRVASSEHERLLFQDRSKQVRGVRCLNPLTPVRKLHMSHFRGSGELHMPEGWPAEVRRACLLPTTMDGCRGGTSGSDTRRQDLKNRATGARICFFHP